MSKRRRRKTYQHGIYRRRIGGHARRMIRSLGGMSAVPDRQPRCRTARGMTLINYGVSRMPTWPHGDIRWINHPDAVAVSSCKLLSLHRLDSADVPHVPFTEYREVAREWLDNEKAVFARTILCGSRGDGIVVVRPGSGRTVPSAPLYTRNWPKTHEFRVHVAGGQVIDVVEKKARSGVEADRAIRNHRGGWVFAHDDLAASPDAFDDIAVRAVNALGLDFGAVDLLAILADPKPGERYRGVKHAVVCEVNSAPAWECTQTFAAYQEYFRNELTAQL